MFSQSETKPTKFLSSPKWSSSRILWILSIYYAHLRTFLSNSVSMTKFVSKVFAVFILSNSRTVSEWLFPSNCLCSLRDRDKVSKLRIVVLRAFIYSSISLILSSFCFLHTLYAISIRSTNILHPTIIDVDGTFISAVFFVTGVSLSEHLSSKDSFVSASLFGTQYFLMKLKTQSKRCAISCLLLLSSLLLSLFLWLAFTEDPRHWLSELFRCSEFSDIRFPNKGRNSLYFCCFFFVSLLFSFPVLKWWVRLE